MSNRDLDRAGITDPALRAAYTTGNRLFRTHGKGRYSGRYLFPAAKRPYFDVFFAFVTYIDDIVDDFDRSVAVRAQRLDEWEGTFRSFADGAAPANSRTSSRDERSDAGLSQALVDVFRTWHLPVERVPEFVEGQRQALLTAEYTTEEQLDEFIQTVTLLPAVWINQIFEPISAEAEQLCRNTITAFQLLDFLWDIHEDLELGRLYLPTEHLSAFGLDRARLEGLVGSGHASRELRELVRFEIDQAKSYLDAGREWPRTLHPTSRTFMQLDMDTHYLMLDELQKNDCEFFSKPRSGVGFFSLKVVPRTARAVTRAARINRRAGAGALRVPRPAQQG